MNAKFKNMRVSFPFNPKKAEVAFWYLLDRMGGHDAYIHLLKLMFLADRFHIRKHLRPISTDNYVVMNYGPVASFLYDVCRGKRKSEFIKAQGEYEIIVSGKRPDLGELSRSDKEAMDWAFDTFAGTHKWDLVDAVHAYPEWQRYAERFCANREGFEDIHIEDFFSDKVDTQLLKKADFEADPFPPIGEAAANAVLDEMIEYWAQLA